MCREPWIPAGGKGRLGGGAQPLGRGRARAGQVLVEDLGQHVICQLALLVLLLCPHFSASLRLLPTCSFPICIPGCANQRALTFPHMRRLTLYSSPSPYCTLVTCLYRRHPTNTAESDFLLGFHVAGSPALAREREGRPDHSKPHRGRFQQGRRSAARLETRRGSARRRSTRAPCGS